MRDDEDYNRCIRGFLHIAQELILKEQKESNIQENLPEYFFNENINALETERKYLLSKISEASAQGQITDAKDNSLANTRLLELQKEPQLLPFFEW